MASNVGQTEIKIVGAVAKEVVHCLDECLAKIGHCVDQLTDEQFWWRPHPSMNSIGNLLLHLNGNVQQWIISGVGGEVDKRNRPSEFSERRLIPKGELLDELKKTLSQAKELVLRLTAEQVLQQRRIQGFEVNGIGAILDCTTHFKGHTPEIISLTRTQLGDNYRFHWQPSNPEEGAPVAAFQPMAAELKSANQLPIGAVFIESAAKSFQSNKDWADRAVAQLPNEKLHIAIDENTNSIVVIMKHVAGNLLSRWTDFLTSDGEKTWRNRDDEFIDTFTSRVELVVYWERGWKCLFETLSSLQPNDLSETVMIRGEAHSVPLAIHRSLAHCGYHVGQIVMIARILAGENWETLTIPRGGSAAYNERVWGSAKK